MQQSRGATEGRGVVRASGAAATQVGSGARAGRGQGCCAGLQRGFPFSASRWRSALVGLGAHAQAAALLHSAVGIAPAMAGNRGVHLLA